MELSLLFKLLHVLSAMALVTGLVGRWITNAQAEHSSDLGSMEALLGASLRFERMVIGSSLAVLFTGLATAWLMKLPILGAFEGAQTNWILVSLALFLLIMVLVPPLVFLPAGRAFETARAAAHRARDAGTAGGLRQRARAGSAHHRDRGGPVRYRSDGVEAVLIERT